LTSRDFSPRLSNVTARTTKRDDHVDRWLDEVRAELPPDLDLTAEGVVDRVLGIGRRLQKLLDETLSAHKLSHGEWKVLSSLRWAGTPYRRSAGELARIADLSSGAMTNRLDRLEKAGLVKRLPDPTDRRGVVVEITKAGQKAWLESAGAEAAREVLIAAALSDREKKQLNSLLRRLMLEFERREGSESKKV
jgi:DNA-binding MarR family transcriptional regulator